MSAMAHASDACMVAADVFACRHDESLCNRLQSKPPGDTGGLQKEQMPIGTVTSPSVVQGMLLSSTLLLVTELAQHSPMSERGAEHSAQRDIMPVLHDTWCTAKLSRTQQISPSHPFTKHASLCSTAHCKARITAWRCCHRKLRLRDIQSKHQRLPIYRPCTA